MLNCFPCVPI